MVTNEDMRAGNDEFREAHIARRADGIGAALRVLCPTCSAPLPEELLALVRQLDRLPPVSAPGSAHPPRP